jgi:hypothetical protein
MPFMEPWVNEVREGDLVFGVSNDEKTIGKAVFLKTHQNGVSMTQYNVTNIENMFSQTPQGNAAQFDHALAGHKKYSQATGADDSNEVFRWKCKGGLYWATFIETQAIKVHFVLDDLDLKQVVKKSNSSDIKGRNSCFRQVEKSRSVTGSELRWIYRNRAHPGVRQRIQFWLNDAPCGPPWVSNGRLWARYKPKVVHVHDDWQVML